MSLKRALRLNNKPDYGAAMETIIFNELIVRGYQVYVEKPFKGEVDFLVFDGDQRCYIQACYEISDNSSVMEREFGGFDSIDDQYPKYVIALDTQEYSQKGIQYLNALDFLTGKKDIEFK